MPGTPSELKPVSKDLSPEDDAATVEVERVDPSELLPFLPVQSLDDLKGLIGPLERRRMQQRAVGAGGRAADGTVPLRRHSAPTAVRAVSVEPATGEQLGPAEPTVPILKTALFTGAARWLVPLGLCTLVTLALAAWALWGH